MKKAVLSLLPALATPCKAAPAKIGLLAVGRRNALHTAMRAHTRLHTLARHVLRLRKRACGRHTLGKIELRSLLIAKLASRSLCLAAMPPSCPGHGGSPCCFSLQQPGRAARRQRGRATCAPRLHEGSRSAQRARPISVTCFAQVLCDPERLAESCLQPQSRGHVKRLLLAFSREVQERALDRVPEDLRAYFVGELRPRHGW